jgi:hypothetical protein
VLRTVRRGMLELRFYLDFCRSGDVDFSIVLVFGRGIYIMMR